MTRSLDDILAEFDPLDQVVFDPIQLEPPTRARPLLPPTFSGSSHPFDYFSLFFTPDLFHLITTNTNRYTDIQRIHAVEERLREWNTLLVEELYVFIGAIIYMGVHSEPNISIY